MGLFDELFGQHPQDASLTALFASSAAPGTVPQAGESREQKPKATLKRNREQISSIQAGSQSTTALQSSDTATSKPPKLKKKKQLGAQAAPNHENHPVMAAKPSQDVAKKAKLLESPPAAHAENAAAKLQVMSAAHTSFSCSWARTRFQAAHRSSSSTHHTF